MTDTEELLRRHVAVANETEFLEDLRHRTPSQQSRLDALRELRRRIADALDASTPEP